MTNYRNPFYFNLNLSNMPIDWHHSCRCLVHCLLVLHLAVPELRPHGESVEQQHLSEYGIVS